MFSFKLGDKLRDKITGFTGINTGRVQYLTGCIQYLLVPRGETENKLPDGEWFDEGRLEVVEEGLIPFNEDKKIVGPDLEPPKR
jgi:hypothetical protein